MNAPLRTPITAWDLQNHRKTLLTTHEKMRFHYAWVVLVMVTVVVFGALGLARFGYTAVLPEMQLGLDLDNTRAGVLASANLLGYLIFAVSGGALAARFGPRVVISAGMTVVGLSMLLTGLAGSFVSAALWRALAGMGSGASNVPAMGLLPAWFAAKRRGLAAGIGVSGSSLALILIGPAVPIILRIHGQWGWRIAWGIFGILALAIAALSALLLRNRPADLGFSPLGGTSAPATNAPETEGLSWSRVYRSRLMWETGLVYMAFGFSYIIYMTFFKKYLVAEIHCSQEAAGNLFMTMGWFSLLCGLIWGSISDYIGRRQTLIILYLIHALAFSLFVCKSWPAAILASAILFGLTAWSIPAIMAALCGDLLGARLAPAGLGFVTLFFGAGQALGPSAAGIIADRLHSLSPAFLLAAFIALLGAIGSAFLKPHPSEC